jgi:hypothetical protein
MAKPLFRFTVGSCIQQGLDILAESIKKTTATLGVENFDWMICYNGLSQDDLEFLSRAIGDRPITLFPQNWSHCPIPDECQSPRREDGTIEWNGNRCGGTLWKVCPPRMRMEAHEIVMDNDIILLKKFPEIDSFLSTTKKALILEEHIRFYGRYDEIFGPGGPFLNSGLMGFPPNYDFGAEIKRVWEENGKYTRLTQADEQGLLMYTLSRIPSFRIKQTQMIEVLARDFKSRINGEEEAIHFTQANRIMPHRSWRDYKSIMEKK